MIRSLFVWYEPHEKSIPNIFNGCCAWRWSDSATQGGVSPSIEIPIQIWKKKFADKLHKSYKKTSVANFTYLFWTFYFASRTKNKLKQLYFNGAMSMFFPQSLHLPKNKQPKWRLLWSRTREITLAGSHSLHWARNFGPLYKLELSTVIADSEPRA